eukprot:jgi/Chlat1/7246/Chrsp58S06870
MAPGALEVATPPNGAVESLTINIGDDNPAVIRKTLTITPCRLEFSKISYKVMTGGKKDQKELVLLDSISGAAVPGELMAIIGQSGAGKSTLLDVLAGRVLRSSIEGTMLVNGTPVDDSFRKRAAYVMQDDALFPLLTVQETLLYSARLRLPWRMPLAEKQQRVVETLAELGLSHTANRIIGDEQHRGISGGERRRVSIGVDMIHDPALIFLDEPTSGLDSKSALNVCQSLHDLARSGRTVVLTIHQPSSRIIELIDKVLVLSGGKLVYAGPPRLIGEFFATYGRPMPNFMNSFEFALDIVDELKVQDEGVAPLEEFYKIHRRTSMEGVVTVGPPSRSLQDAPKTESQIIKDEYASKAKATAKESTRPPYANTPLTEVAILANRIFTNQFRTKELFFARLGLAVGVGIVSGTLFLRLDKTYSDYQNYKAFVAYAAALFIFTSAEALPIFLLERNIFTRETSRGAYRTSSYVLAHTFTPLPFMAVIAFVYPLVTWWLVGLPGGAGNFFFFVLTLFVILAVANAFVMFFSAVVTNFMVGNSMITALFAFMFLFSGFFIKRGDIPGWWIWIYYISLFKYAFDSFVVNLFRGFSSDTHFGCSGQAPAGDCFLTPQQLLDDSDMGGTNRWTGIGALIGFTILYRFLFYVALRLRNSGTRK